jgi:hypothetical protein
VQQVDVLLPKKPPKALVISGSTSVDLSFNETSSRKHADTIVRVFKGVSQRLLLELHAAV